MQAAVVARPEVNRRWWCRCWMLGAKACTRADDEVVAARNRTFQLSQPAVSLETMMKEVMNETQRQGMKKDCCFLVPKCSAARLMEGHGREGAPVRLFSRFLF